MKLLKSVDCRMRTIAYIYRERKRKIIHAQIINGYSYNLKTNEFFRLKLNFKRKCINQNTVNDDDTVTNMKSKEIKKGD